MKKLYRRMRRYDYSSKRIYKKDWEAKNRKRKRKARICIWCARKAYRQRQTCYHCLVRNRIGSRKNRVTLKNLVYERLGNKCCCCGVKEQVFLTVDHVKNNGAKERWRLFGKRTGASYLFLKRIRDKGFPKREYQLLCYNCNIAKYRLGKCPHKERKR